MVGNNAGITPLQMEMEMSHNSSVIKGDVVRLIEDHSYTVYETVVLDPDDEDAPYIPHRVRLDAGCVIVVDAVGDDIYGDLAGERVHLTTARFEVVRHT